MDKSVCISHFYKTEPHPLVAKAPQVVTYEPLGTQYVPIITGRHVSRPMEEILDEVKYLVARGVKEFQVIAQELTYYGVDLYKKQMLPELVERISDIPGVEWIRLHYAYPAHFPADLFRVMRERDNVCKYMDIALQHISDNMLNKMRRHVLCSHFVPGWSR